MGKCFTDDRENTMLKPFEVMFLTVADQSVSNKLVEKIKEMILSKGEIESFDA